MFFIALTFLAAFLIEGLGTYVSVIGLSTLFGANPIIIALAIALDMGKLVVVTLLYTHWRKLGTLMKSYALVASVITMVITSAGAAGYLSGEFQKAILGTQEVGLKVGVLKAEQAKLEDRKKQIDAGIAAIPDRYTANQKIRLMSQFKDEQKQVTTRLTEISKQLPEMQITQIGVEAKAGPILYVAKAFDIPVESAVKWVILMIIFVFDPLAVFLIIAGNFLAAQRRPVKSTEEQIERTVYVPEEVPEVRNSQTELTTPPPPVLWKDADMGPTLYEDCYVDPVYKEPNQHVYFPTQEMSSQLHEILEPAADDEVKEVVTEVSPSVNMLPDMPLVYDEAAAVPSFVAAQSDVDRRDQAAADKAGMSLEDWRAEQLRRIDALQSGIKALSRQLSPEQPREEITLSTLGVVKPDPSTITDIAAGDDFEVGLGTGAFKTGAPQR